MTTKCQTEKCRRAIGARPARRRLQIGKDTYRICTRCMKDAEQHARRVRADKTWPSATIFDTLKIAVRGVEYFMPITRSIT